MAGYVTVLAEMESAATLPVLMHAGCTVSDGAVIQGTQDGNAVLQSGYVHLCAVQYVNVCVCWLDKAGMCVSIWFDANISDSLWLWAKCNRHSFVCLHTEHLPTLCEADVRFISSVVCRSCDCIVRVYFTQSQYV